MLAAWLRVLRFLWDMTTWVFGLFCIFQCSRKREVYDWASSGIVIVMCLSVCLCRMTRQAVVHPIRWLVLIHWSTRSYHLDWVTAMPPLTLVTEARSLSHRRSTWSGPSIIRHCPQTSSDFSHRWECHLYSIQVLVTTWSGLSVTRHCPQTSSDFLHRWECHLYSIQVWVTTWSRLRVTRHCP